MRVKLGGYCKNAQFGWFAIRYRLPISLTNLSPGFRDFGKPPKGITSRRVSFDESALCGWRLVIHKSGQPHEPGGVANGLVGLESLRKDSLDQRPSNKVLQRHVKSPVRMDSMP